MRLYGSQLDDYHVLSKLTDKNGNISWWLFTFQNPIKNCIVKCGTTKEMWRMEQINPNNFEWNGERFKIA